MVYETPEQEMQNAKRTLITQRAGGTHRPGRGSIGRGSAELKRKNLVGRLKGLGLTLVAIMGAVIATGIIIDGIGFAGVMMTFAAIVAAVLFFAFVPKTKVPKRAELKLGNPQQMVARTELWLEAQRSALPPAAQQVVDQMGVRLDALGAQLQTLGNDHPAMDEVRELVGEYIPETIENYRMIPAHLRGEKHTGKTADERLTESLTRLSNEVDRVTRKLAEGAMDDLAVKARYLDYRYGEDQMIQDMRGDPSTAGVPLPDLAINTPEKVEQKR